MVVFLSYVLRPMAKEAARRAGGKGMNPETPIDWIVLIFGIAGTVGVIGFEIACLIVGNIVVIEWMKER